ncbi:Zn(II)2Cys6 transcription factor domain-containing protein [Aspergillus alliaceus]|uniref:Zn(II)2Cys6 transcription factor domain-containing protein n=1 Tax=Petromyces alliaceus TaxID=209559 RepID=UPI0012A3B868|nr:uncharacterized protein BDW43DRAFT_55285 [Aspergillus alliaceus]KAB8234435.1 hypothetical protein BDW43DRAFT_55285 [Aspergillus alliaceus]
MGTNDRDRVHFTMGTLMFDSPHYHFPLEQHTNSSPINTLRACHSCHVSKVRCDQPNPGLPCVRCQKACKPCFPVEKSRNDQKQLNNRIMEIQSKIDKMISTAVSQESAGDKTRSVEGPFRGWPVGSSSNVPGQHIRGPSMGPAISLPSTVSSGAVDLKTNIRSFLDKDISPYLDGPTMEIIFNRYTSNIASTFPVVVFPSGTTAAKVRKDNPILLLAILDVASSGFCELEIQRRLRKLIVQTYVHCMLRSDQYTLGLLQALIVSATWYRSIEPLEPGEQMDIYQIGHTAANMALIMGLGDKLNNGSRESSVLAQKGQGDRYQSARAEALDARRVWLGCHYICSNTSMSLRAPNVMRWTHCMDECLEELETSPDALPSDKILCYHIRLQHITEEASMQLSLKDTSTSVSLRDMQMQASHRLFRRLLADWRSGILDDHWNGTLELSYHFSLLYTNEVAFCAAPGNATSDAELASPSQPPTVTIPADIFSECVNTVDHLFLMFTSLDMFAIRVLPAMHLIRMIYTVLILVKLHFAAIASSDEDAQLQVDRLQVSKRLTTIIQIFTGWGPLWPATKLTTVFRRICSWFEDDQTMKREGSSLNVWRLGPTSQSPGLNQLCSNHESLLFPGSGGWSTSTGMENMPLSFDSALDIGAPALSEPATNYSLPPSNMPTSVFNDISVGDDLGIDLNMMDEKNSDNTLGVDLELNRLPFNLNSPEMPFWSYADNKSRRDD